jgi:glycosyltransferase involved in cell wall biosynthesis
MKNITFIVFAYNEEKRIEYIVKNCIKYGKVLILDGGSTDKTREISEREGATFILRPNVKSKFAENQEMYEFIKKNVDTNWIFWNFCDNLMSNSLLEKLVELSKQNKIKYVVFPLYTYLWGNTKKPAIKAKSPRFFMKDYIDFTNNHIHGMGTFLGKDDEILKLSMEEKNSVKHFSTYDLKKFIMSHLNYAEIEALEKFENGYKFSFFKMTKSIIKNFLYWYKDGYKNGLMGFMIAILYSFFQFMIFFRLYELENNLSLETIEESYAKEKEKMIK